MSQAFRSIFAESGIAGLFRGFTATAIRDAPYAGLYVLFYEESKVVAGVFHNHSLLSPPAEDAKIGH